MKYDIVSSNHNIDPSTGMIGDHIIRLTGYKTSKLYPKELRLIKFCDFETGEELEFITNITDQLELSGLEIANIYRHRWDIESFFKLIKQNLTIKHLWGCSENAVKTHLDCCLYLSATCEDKGCIQQSLFNNRDSYIRDCRLMFSIRPKLPTGPIRFHSLVHQIYIFISHSGRFGRIFVHSL